MPQGSGYEGYAYSIFNDRIKEGTITTDLKSDTRERALVINIPTNQNVELRKGEESIELEPHEFFSLVNGTTSDKYFWLTFVSFFWKQCGGLINVHCGHPHAKSFHLQSEESGH